MIQPSYARARRAVRLFLVISAFLAVRTLPPLQARVAPTIPARVAVIHALDKSVGRVKRLEIPLNHPTRFEMLEICVRECRTTPPEEEAESAAFLEIRDHGPGADPKKIAFSGWMFASAPSLSALEHPIYDLWVLTCQP